jgi:Mrp family chromosome partitioning ATPase
MGYRSAIPEQSSAYGRELASPAGPAAAEQSPAHHYAELSVRLFDISARAVVVFFAVNRGEGVTHTVRQLATELNRAGKRVIVLDGALQPVIVLGPKPGFFSRDWPPRSSWEPAPASEVLADVRRYFDCVLIDCPSLESSLDVLRIAPASDGVVIVVEAGRTSREQLARASQVVREAKGTLLGFVLNKRRYPIPGWLYRML